MKKISVDYKQQAQNIQQFFEFPLSPDWNMLTEHVLKNYHQQEVIRELINQNSDIQSVRGQLHLSYLQEKNTVIIITGQQLGLMVSPLYTIYKSVTTLIMAEKLNRQLPGYHFVPVFWLESEDHDFAEVNHTFIWSKAGLPEKLEIHENPEQSGFSVSQRTLPELVLDTLNLLESQLQETEFTKDLMKDLKTYFQPGRKWLEAFRDMMRRIFDVYGLLLFNPGSRRIKHLSIPFFKSIIYGNDRLFSRIESQTMLLEKLGYEIQVPLDSRKAYLSISLKDGRRQQIFKNSNHLFFARDPSHEWDESRLSVEVEQHPEWISSTVLTRPMWQSWLLPVISYVAGPAETAYWAQLRAAFNEFDLVMPQVQPRLSLTLIEPKIKRLLTKFDLQIADIPDTLPFFIEAYFKQNRLGDLHSEYQNMMKTLDQHQAEYKQKALQMDQTLSPLVQKTFESIRAQLERLQGRFIKQAEESDQLTLRQLQTIHESLFPVGKAQERIISPVYFFNKYGQKWLDDIYQSAKADELKSPYFYL